MMIFTLKASSIFEFQILVPKICSSKISLPSAAFRQHSGKKVH